MDDANFSPLVAVGPCYFRQLVETRGVLREGPLEKATELGLELSGGSRRRRASRCRRWGWRMDGGRGRGVSRTLLSGPQKGTA